MLGFLFPTTLESNFDVDYYRKWFRHNWHVSIYFSIAYCIAVWVGRWYMSDKKPYRWQTALILWNAGLAIFSIMGSSRVVSELISTLFNKGLEATICDNSFVNDRAVCFWMFLFTWSKLFEFGDTLFIIVRKQQLIFLHWIHHALTFILCCFLYSDLNGNNRWLTGMNFSIHSIMYSYYMLKAMKFPVPGHLALVITRLQILQMIVGFFANLYPFFWRRNDPTCAATTDVTFFCLIVYALFGTLFINFFIQSRHRFTKKSDFNSNNDARKIQ